MLRQNPIAELAQWRSRSPGYKAWLKAAAYKDEAVEDKAALQILKSTVFDICQVTQKTPQDVIPSLMGEDIGILQGVCDEYHAAHLQILNYIRKWIDTPKSKVKNVLDYYGRTGEFTLKVARLTDCRVTYIDQQPWFNYIKTRTQIRGVRHIARGIEATPSTSRPDVTDQQYGLICSLDLPLTPTPDWLDWAYRLLYPNCFLVTRCQLDWKRVAIIEPHWTIYQKT